MDYHQFVDEVAERADVSREQAEALTRATLWTLGERITGGEARHIAGQLPVELQTRLIAAEEEAEGFSLDEFIRRTAERAGVDRGTADIGTAAVFATLRDTISGDDVRHMMSQLPLEFREVAPGPRLSDVRVTGGDLP
ncbi:Uncharacterised protein [Amycolatopsis camponoti]|uniref:DUF2267 domain-containing protein n=1 Tax=Amycolatopsis camponoti TaxID=2606593 RepID=A0A6I8M2W3_9PSEU|nr:DUF2267 domain-containing protein [Amycolatopsis camponoti]VVJ21883.1 Uncharacterised protein [Amycolatopsis camponoti]